jgi:hypothetical protein
MPALQEQQLPHIEGERYVEVHLLRVGMDGAGGEKIMDAKLENFSYVSKVVELNKCAADLLFGLEKIKKIKDDLERRCQEIGIAFEIYDEDNIRWISKEAEKNPLQK